MYDTDSFFTLGTWGRVGLLAISAALTLLWVLLAIQLRRFSRLRAGLAGLALFWLFVWLSPQFYYAYYLLLFDGLPIQWVARAPEPATILRLLSFTERATLSAHGVGILGWLVLLSAILWPRRNAAN